MLPIRSAVGGSTIGLRIPTSRSDDENERWRSSSIHNHFNKDRHLNRRDVFKQNRSAALAEWRQLAA
jgi:hypothetical protein